MWGHDEDFLENDREFSKEDFREEDVMYFMYHRRLATDESSSDSESDSLSLEYSPPTSPPCFQPAEFEEVHSQTPGDVVMLETLDKSGVPLDLMEIEVKSKTDYLGPKLADPGPKWTVGDPLREIWKDDAKIPTECIKRDERRKKLEDAKFQARLKGNTSKSSLKRACGDLLTESTLPFEWFPSDTFQGEQEPFLVSCTGSVEKHTDAYGAFRSYWDDKILNFIVIQTNKYAKKISSKVFQKTWYPTTVDEILCLFAFWMLLGIIRMSTIKSCFSNRKFLSVNVFKDLFTYKRYINLNRALHFYTAGDRFRSDPLRSLRPIVSYLNKKFSSAYVLEQNITIDESLTLWKGRLDFKQFKSLKAGKFGIKTYELCEGSSGYLWSFLVHTRQMAVDADVANSAAIVKTLIDPLLDKGHCLFINNRFGSVPLARYLKSHKTDVVGTLKSNRPYIPSVIHMAPLERGEFVARHCGDVFVLSWMHKRRVTTMSTFTGPTSATRTVSSVANLSRPVPFKPQSVLIYNKYKGGVDLKDQMLEPFLLERKHCAKWYIKLFKRFLNVSIHNARILLQSSSGVAVPTLDFRSDLVEAIIDKHLSLVRSKHCSNPLVQQPTPIVQTSQHYIVRMKPPGEVVGKIRKRCVQCYRNGRKNVKTPFKCEECDLPLCLVGCMKAYHTARSS